MRRELMWITALLVVGVSAPAWAAIPAEAEEEGVTLLEVLPDFVTVNQGFLGQTHRVYRRRTYRRYWGPHRRTNVVIVGHHHPQTTVVYREPDPEPRVVTRKHRIGMSGGLRFMALSLGDTSLRYETLEGATLGGIGGYLRGRLDKHWGLEFSVDVMGAEETDYEQINIPLMGGIVAHLFPDSALDLYGIAGMGVHFNSLKYYADSRTFSEGYAQLVGQFGTGLEINLGVLQLITDVRWLFMQTRPERDTVLRQMVPLGGDSKDADALSHGLQFTFGLGGNF